MELPEAVNAYEEERRQRIERNQQVLQGLGLLDNPLGAAAAARAQQRAGAQRAAAAVASAAERKRPELPAEDLQPARRSRRLQGENAADNCLGPQQHQLAGHTLCRAVRDVALEGAEPRMRAPSRAAPVGVDELDQHNIMRIRSMSEKALRTRIWKIQRVDKLKSFIHMLDACCLEELAAEARHALRELCGGMGWSSDEDGAAAEGAEVAATDAAADVKEEFKEEAECIWREGAAAEVAQAEITAADAAVDVKEELKEEAE